MKLRAILFDAGGILYHRPGRWQRTHDFLASLRLEEVSSEHPRWTELKTAAHAGQITELEYHEALLDLFGVSDPAARVQGREILYEEERNIEFFESVGDTLQRLKEMGYKLGIVTNTFITTDEKLAWFARIGIDDLWDSFATSCELGIVKPDPRIYQSALDPLGIHAAESAFVGHSTRDLEAARELGMLSIAFNRDDESVSAEHLMEEFEDLLHVVGETA